MHPVHDNDLVIYYDVEGKPYPRRIDLGNATADDLQELSAACQICGASGLLEAISSDILQGQNTNADNYVRAEMYKPNDDGPRSFFKAHQDTPRREDMIGSFVVIFPTAHAGGALTLEHDGIA
ncbi:hypothetical protein C8J57DRAFT_1272886 [Mycena rebaudengoi]|nr:hypothetical protein C8J57DRAFT_1272886 [Mycena rebaudengoi]